MKKIVILILSVCLLPHIGITQQNTNWEDLPDDVKNSKAFKRFEWLYKQRAYPSDTIPYHRYFKVIEKEIIKIKESRVSREGFSFWTSLGPNGVQNTGMTSNWGLTSGRVRAIAVHPSDPLTLYIGAACGGIWKSTDGGDNWQDIGRELESLSFGAIAIDPGNTDIIYAASGESVMIAGILGFSGKGLYKSYDGGLSWEQITTGIGEQTHFSDIEVCPHNSNIVLASMASGSFSAGANMPNEGVWKSSDGGYSWSRTLNVEDAYDILFHPSDPDTVYAAVGGESTFSGFYISSDQGNTWIQSNNGLQDELTIARMHIDLAKSLPEIIYAVTYEFGTGNMFSGTTRAFKSFNSGKDWEQISTYVQLGGYYSGSGWRDQGFYDLCIAVNPSNPDNVFIGNIELHKTTNGSTFGPVRPYGSGSFGSLAHADYHKLVFAPSDNNYLYIGCDGGIYKSTDGGLTASSQNAGLETLQFYRLGSHPTDHDKIIGGLQDNFSILTTDGGQNWEQVSLSDGMECLFDYSNPDTIYYLTQTGAIFRSSDGGNSFQFRYFVNGAWITPFLMHPTNSKTLYTANKSIIRSDNGGESFEIIADNVAPALISTLHQSCVNPDNMIFGTGGGDTPAGDTVYIVKVSTDGGYNWIDVTDNIPNEKRWISRVVTDPVDENTMYLLRNGFSPGNKVYKTTDLGQNWTNISGDLPDIPCSDLFIDPENTDHLYIANDIGVYLTTDGGSTWNYAGDGMPFVPVFDFDYISYGTDRYLRAGTHGRSLYEANLLHVGIEDPELPQKYTTERIQIKIYPNPLVDKTTIHFDLQQSEKVEITLYNQLGLLIRNIQHKEYQKGKHKFVWHASGLSDGIYFVQVRAGQEMVTRKIVKMR